MVTQEDLLKAIENSRNTLQTHPKRINSFLDAYLTTLK